VEVAVEAAVGVRVIAGIVDCVAEGVCVGTVALHPAIANIIPIDAAAVREKPRPLRMNTPSIPIPRL
jgi:hypothetical protein